MRILLTNYSLGWLGGTQTWVQVVKKELELLGHEVHLFAADKDYNLFNANFKPFNDELEYDIAFINHNICLTALQGINIKKKVFISHGVIPELEQPVEGADIYVAVSEEVQNNLRKQGFESHIIRNPIDLSVFKPYRNVNTTLKNILFLSNYQGNALKVIEEASKKYNLRVFGKNKQIKPSEVLEQMHWADIVIALGRTAYEAMALNRNVIVFDYNGADGFVDMHSIYEYRKNNCSGRYNKMNIGPKALLEMFGKFNPHLQLRDYIKQEHDSKAIVEKLLNLRNH